MVDYSKWDKLDVSDDEAPHKPQVHRYDKPQTVTFGGGKQPQGAGEDAQAMDAEDADDDDDEPMEPPEGEPEPGEDVREDVLNLRGLAERALRRGEAGEAVRLLERAMALGGGSCPGLEDVLKAARLAESGKATAAQGPRPDPRVPNRVVVDDRYAWAQSKDEVELDVYVEEGCKAKEVSVSVSEETLAVLLRGKPVLQGAWEHKVQEEDVLDWEMRTADGRRAVHLAVKKAALPGGMSVVVWWRRLLKGEEAIDVSELEGRKPDKSAAFAKAWQEAHAQFKESVKNRKPVEIEQA